MPELPQDLSDSSIIPSPGVQVVSRRKTNKENDAMKDIMGGEEDDDVLISETRVSKDEQEMQSILMDVQSSLEAPLSTRSISHDSPCTLYS